MAETEQVFNDVEVYGISAVQGLILALLTTPVMLEAYFSKFGALTRHNIALFLELKDSEVDGAFNEKLTETLWNECVLNLRNARALVDSAMLQSARTPNAYGTADRKLYYELIGVTGKKGMTKGTDRLTREEKLELLEKNLSRITDYSIRKEIFNGRNERKRPVNGRPARKASEASEGTEGETTDNAS